MKALLAIMMVTTLYAQKVDEKIIEKIDEKTLTNVNKQLSSHEIGNHDYSYSQDSSSEVLLESILYSDPFDPKKIENGNIYKNVKRSLKSLQKTFPKLQTI